jgi:hypothetical protein
MNKAIVIATLNSLPQDFKTEELIEKLLFIEDLEKEVKDLTKSETKPSEDGLKLFNISLN